MAAKCFPQKENSTSTVADLDDWKVDFIYIYIYITGNVICAYKLEDQSNFGQHCVEVTTEDKPLFTIFDYNVLILLTFSS